MPHAASKYFGTLEFQLSDLFHFRRGLPGFEQETEFCAVNIPAQEPLMYLQSIHTPELCLITLPARACCHDYRLELTPEERDLLSLPNAIPHIGVEVACQVIVTVDEMREPAANLAAPIVINLANRLALQAFQVHSEYSFQHLLSAPSLSPVCL